MKYIRNSAKTKKFYGDPVNNIIWVEISKIKSNDWNPNVVAKPEFDLLETSIKKDGLTMPIVCYYENGVYEIVDGFHRTLVCKKLNRKYMPVSLINKNRSDRISSTIRHNRARGKHDVSSMSDIVIELKNRGWSDLSIINELGMDKDEILRLTQITGLTEMFSDKEFSEAWKHEKNMA